MPLIYDISIRLFGGAVAVGGLFNHKARLLSQGRRSLLDHVEQQMARPSRNYSHDGRSIWVHCASLGEFEQGRPLIEALRKQRPEQRIVLTFFSPSGYEIRKGYDGVDDIFYLPADTRHNARRFIDAIRPEMAIFVKYEYWYHYLNNLKKEHIPSYVVSAIFRPDMIFFKPWGGFMRRTLGLLSHLYVQNRSSEALLMTIGLCNVTVSGDTRFDRVAALAHNAPELPILQRFAANSRVIVCGSTWPEDEELIASLVAANAGTKFIIAPHEINDRQRIERLAQIGSRRGMLYTQASLAATEGISSALEQDLDRSDLMVIDTIGILSGAYRYGEIAYIGGGFGRGIHNTLESATWGMPVIFGPKYKAFAEAVDMVSLGVAHPISDATELCFEVAQLIGNPDMLREQGRQAAEYVRSRCGATDKIISEIT